MNKPKWEPLPVTRKNDSGVYMIDMMKAIVNLNAGMTTCFDYINYLEGEIKRLKERKD